MRMTIILDSVPDGELRDILKLANRADCPKPKVGLDGPTHMHVTIGPTGDEESLDALLNGLRAHQQKKKPVDPEFQRLLDEEAELAQRFTKHAKSSLTD